MPQISPLHAPQRSSIGNALVHLKLSNGSDYKLTNSPFLPRCASSTTSFMYPSSTSSDPRLSPHAFLPHLPCFTSKTTKNTSKLRIYLTPDAMTIVVSSASSNGKVFQFLTAPGNPFRTSPHVASLKNFTVVILANPANRVAFTLLDCWFNCCFGSTFWFSCFSFLWFFGFWMLGCLWKCNANITTF